MELLSAGMTKCLQRIDSSLGETARRSPSCQGLPTHERTICCGICVMLASCEQKWQELQQGTGTAGMEEGGWWRSVFDRLPENEDFDDIVQRRNKSGKTNTSSNAMHYITAGHLVQRLRRETPRGQRGQTRTRLVTTQTLWSPLELQPRGQSVGAILATWCTSHVE